MKLRTVYACALNLNSQEGFGFDAFEANENLNIFTLCDGANSCAGSGEAAAWLSKVMALGDHDQPTDQLMTRHIEMLEKFPDTGSTLVRVRANLNLLELTSIGDSFLWLFKKKWGGWGAWQCIEKMPRDVNELGHPTQLVGSEVCHTLHVRNFEPNGLYCAILMSDGPGLLTSDLSLKKCVSILDRDEPSSADLAYLCHSIATDAQNAGCTDDTSVAMVWLKYS